MQENNQKLGCLRNQINSLIAEDNFRTGMRIITEDGKAVTGIAIELRDGLAVAVIRN